MINRPSNCISCESELITDTGYLSTKTSKLPNISGGFVDLSRFGSYNSSQSQKEFERFLKLKAQESLKKESEKKDEFEIKAVPIKDAPFREPKKTEENIAKDTFVNEKKSQEKNNFKKSLLRDSNNYLDIKKIVFLSAAALGAYAALRYSKVI